ncbi:putative B3 domain-containing protein Os03g0621600 [Chenopodium quinoa]|uniref:putative B3 domain-containing protein Os03g0621600 n=1 Tax=Chenopodium quinoa TaxID=63459 RepID=UPI000B77EC74|nr:putative B3 domain-containing protein Os03g0621600 [Chenopodium quinoa]
MENKTYFYKIMISPSSQTNKLRIPEEYVNKNGQQFAFDHVRLRVGKDGRVWRVEVYKENDQIWLTQGWERVVMNYSIKRGDFLLFKYDERDSMFQLKIFDTTGFEIEYDHQQVEQISSASEEEEMDLDDDDDDDLSFSEDDDVAVHEPMDPTDVKSRLDAYKTKKPHFKVIMRPSYVSNGFRYRIPAKFVKKYGEELSDEIYLNVPNSEQPWKVELHKENNVMSLGKGWQVFMEFYALEYGHFLAFRFDGGLQSHFHVLIFDNRDYDNEAVKS